MKTLEQILNYNAGENCNFLDGRDKTRLAAFVRVEDFGRLGLTLNDGATHTPIDFTRENVLEKLKNDLDFAFSKALGQRGISSSLMHDVIKMWMWVLDDELSDYEEYAQYGLPLYKRVAVKYNLPNPIGDDQGNEQQYSSDYMDF